MKNLIYTSFLFLISSLCRAQRYGGKRLYEETGLPSGKVVGDSLKYAIPILIVGFLIAYINLWSEAAQKTKNKNDNLGCAGMIIIGVGLIFLLPLLSWVEFAVQSIILFIMAIGATGFIIAIAYSAFNKKK